MRVLDSQIRSSVDSLSQRDASELRVSKVRHTQTNLDDNQQVIGSQETIHLSYSQSYESEQSSRLYAHSEIRNTAEGTQTTITQEELTHALVSGVLERNVHLADVVYAGSDSLRNLENNAFIEDLSSAINLELSEVITESPQDDSGERVSRSTELSVHHQHVIQNHDSLALISEGNITLSDGRLISYRLELDLQSNYTEVTNQELRVRSEDFVDPLVISLDGRAPSLTDATFSFDLDSDGVEDNISGLSSGAGFIAFDKNQDGVINNGQELFGPDSGNGYLDLAAYDENGDGWIDDGDSIFSQLQVWQPSLEEDQGRLQSLKALGVGAINLQAIESPFAIKDERDNTLGLVQRSGIYLKESGEVGLIQQIDLAIRTDVNNSPPSEQAFYLQAAQAEQLFKQRISENQGEAINPNLAINQAIASTDFSRFDFETAPEPVSLDEESLPMLIILSHFEIESRGQENRSLHSTSARSENVVALAPAGSSSSLGEPERTANLDRSRSFNNPAGREDAPLGQQDNLSEFKTKVIEEVLKPLHELLKQRRKLAIESYQRNQFPQR